MKNMIKKIKGEAPFVTYVKKRLKHNLNFIALFSGPTGVGKSYNSLAFAEQLDPEFDAEKQITFNFEETMNLINNKEFLAKKIKVVCWDEPQIEMSNRAWQSQLNKLINYLLSTFRSQNIVLLWASPYKDFLDSQSMKLLHCEFQCLGWDKKTRLSRTKPRLMQYNQDLKRFYPHQLMIIENNTANPMFFWDINEPTEKNRVIYERRKAEFNLKLNANIQNSLEELKPKPKPQQVILPLDTRKSLTDKQQAVMEMLGSGLSGLEVAERLKIKNNTVSQHKTNAENKGYKLSEFKKPNISPVFYSLPLNSAVGAHAPHLSPKEADFKDNSTGEPNEKTN